MSADKVPPRRCEEVTGGFKCRSHFVLSVCADGNTGVQCLLCGNRFASVKNMIKHQEKAHADEVRQHKERARAGEQRLAF